MESSLPTSSASKPALSLPHEDMQEKEYVFCMEIWFLDMDNGDNIIRRERKREREKEVRERVEFSTEKL